MCQYVCVCACVRIYVLCRGSNCFFVCLFVCLFVFPLNYYYMVVEARDLQRSEKRQKAKIIVLLK